MLPQGYPQIWYVVYYNYIIIIYYNIIYIKGISLGKPRPAVPPMHNDSVSNFYASVRMRKFCECVCLFRLYLTSCWKLSADTWNASVSQQYLDFWLAKIWKNGCVLVMCVICSPRRLIGGDPDSCKGYPVYSRLISTLLFHLYHERDGNAQKILIALLSSMLLQEGAAWLAHVLVVLHHLFTHFETTIW